MIDIHVIITAIVGSMLAVSCYSVNPFLGYAAFVFAWLVCEIMLLFRFILRPQRKWRNYVVNQMFPLIVFGVAFALASRAVTKLDKEGEVTQRVVYAEGDSSAMLK